MLTYPNSQQFYPNVSLPNLPLMGFRMDHITALEPNCALL